MNIKIIAVGNIKEKYLKDGINEYVKRIKKYSNISVFEINEVPTNDNSKKSIEIALNKESEAILNKINSKDYVILLDLKGKSINNLELTNLIENKKIDGINDFVFIIGSSHGVSSIVKNIANYKWSFSKLTFPHQLMRLILLEQIYRTFKIINNEPYHK